MASGNSNIDACIEVCLGFLLVFFFLFSRAALFLNQLPGREDCLRKQVSAFSFTFLFLRRVNPERFITSY